VPVKILRPDNNNIEAPVVDEASISTHLNDKVYSQAVTSWNITTHEVLEVETEGAFDNDDPDNRMDYTGGMKDVYREFKDQYDKDNDAVYVFLVPGETENGNLRGYMPLKGQYAFIFMNNIGTGTVENTIAHEIAHGTFNLRHTFSTENAYVLSENSTDNLMDYREGSELNKFQWDFIHNPESVLFAWMEDEEEGEIIIDRYRFTYNVTEQLGEAERTNEYFVVDNQGAINLFSTALTQEINSKLKSVNDNGQPVYVIVDLFTYTEAKDIDQVKSEVDKQVQALKEANKDIVIIVAVGYKLVNENNVPLKEKPDLLIRSEFHKNLEGAASFKDWKPISQTDEAQVTSFIDDLIAALPYNSIFDIEDCLELTYEELGISSASELNPNDVKEWVTAFAGDNGVSIDYSYTGYPVVNNPEIPRVSLNQPENSNADINIAVHFDEGGKKIIICHHYKAGAIVIPSVTASGEPVQETTVDAIVGLSKVYAAKALANAKAGGEKLQALFNSAVKGVVAAKTWTKTICDKMEVPQPVWNDMDNKEAYDRSPVHVEPILSGVGDGTFEELKSIPELITLALDVAFDKDIRTSLWNSIKSISWEDVKNMPMKMVKDKVAVYERGGSIAKHEGGKDAVQIASMVLGFGSLKKGKEVAEEVGEKFGKEIADILKKLPKELKDKLDNFEPEKFKRILSDLKDDDLVAKFVEKPELLDAWEKLSEYPIIRKELSNLENLSSVLTKYPFTEAQLGELAEALGKCGSKQKMLQHINYATKYIEKPEDLLALAKVAPIKALKTLPGSNGKVAIIGRKMDLVKVYKDELVAAGKQVELFDGDIIPANARKEFTEALASGKILDETSEMFKANQKWAEKLLKEGYEIIDIGNPLNTVEESIFYNIELKTIFGNR
ncbi:MAG: hypothetical protein GX660_05860, partial [Clostridiaceae bacterium]|nr:hypothetical protein [Clostridiaceae bacterium]